MGWFDLLAVQGTLKSSTPQFKSISSLTLSLLYGPPRALNSKASVYNAGDPSSIPGLGRSPGEENGNPLQDYCLENPMDRGAWQATVHGVGHD